MRWNLVLLLAATVAACQQSAAPAAKEADGATSNALPASRLAVPLSLSRLDCGKIHVKNFDKFFSDTPGLYSSEPRDITDSCYLIRHGDQLLLWDTGLSGSLKGQNFDAGDAVMSVDRTIAEQLAEMKLTPADIDIVGISHHHDDHTGQLNAFPQARLVIGAGDFEKAQAKPPQGGAPTITPWVKSGANVTKATADVDIFGDGSVIALHLPGHTPDHLALLVRLKGGPVLLSGDLYHSTEARQKRGVPGFNTSREQTLASMDRFEALAKETGAKVVIQHEAGDIGKVPAVPQSEQ
ncbi:MAG TPA: N-acyl homoserine lactonase family protein [Sphingomicrobium sp.]|nr:N-acyl homoserine lactonase family protein [Sphingomicrobium sp.]